MLYSSCPWCPWGSALDPSLCSDLCSAGQQIPRAAFGLTGVYVDPATVAAVTGLLYLLNSGHEAELYSGEGQLGKINTNPPSLEGKIFQHKSGMFIRPFLIVSSKRLGPTEYFPFLAWVSTMFHWRAKESIWSPLFSTGVYRNEEPPPEGQRYKEFSLSQFIYPITNSGFYSHDWCKKNLEAIKKNLNIYLVFLLIQILVFLPIYIALQEPPRNHSCR